MCGTVERREDLEGRGRVCVGNRERERKEARYDVFSANGLLNTKKKEMIIANDGTTQSMCVCI